MALLLDDLLDVSRISRGRVELNIGALVVKEVVEAAVETARPHIASRHHVLEVVSGDESLCVNGGRLRLAQVLSNLLTNATKYTPPGGRIQLWTRRDDDIVEFAITDNGVGIAPDQLERVFEMFWQSKRRSDLQEGGLGIGLALARDLIILHGGTLEARKRRAGAGEHLRCTSATARANAAVTPHVGQAVWSRLPRVEGFWSSTITWTAQRASRCF